MTNSNDNMEKLNDRPHQLALLESMSQFIVARLSVLLTSSTHRPGDASTIARPNTFSREIINKREHFLTANVFGFVSALFGTEFVAAETAGFQGSLVYKEPGRRQQFIHNSIEESVLSLTINKLTQFFGTWLNHQYTVQMLLKLENNALLAAGPQTPSQFSNQHRRLEATPFERHQVFRIVESFLSDKDATSQRQPIQAREALFEFERALQTAYASERGGGRAPDYDRQAFQVIRPELKLYEPPDIAPPPSQEFVVQQPYGSGESRDWTQPRTERRREATPASRVKTSPESMALAFSAREMAEKIEDLYSIKPIASSAPGPWPGVTSERVNRPDRPPGYSARAGWQASQESVPSWPEGLTRIEEFEQKHGPYRSSLSVKPSFAQYADSALLRTTRNEEPADVIKDAFAPQSNRAMAETTQTRGPLREHQQNRVENQFTILRREERMRPPLQSYAYVQPARETIEEQRVVKRTRENEVVDLVRKEVETLMKSGSPITELTRFDYSRITDHVWSSLSRRLMMERERLGR